MQQGTAKVKDERRSEETRRWQRLWRRMQWTGYRGEGGSRQPLPIGNNSWNNSEPDSLT